MKNIKNFITKPWASRKASNTENLEKRNNTDIGGEELEARVEHRRGGPEPCDVKDEFLELIC